MRLAVTGGIAEGKSTVLQAVQEAGFEVASADEIAKEVFQREQVQFELALILGVQAPVAREQLKSALFADPAIRQRVNRLTHPLILEAMMKSGAHVIEVPLLLESATQGLFEGIWVVACGFEEQLRRLTERLGDTIQARRMIEAQLPSRARLPFADRIIRTNGELNTVRLYVFEAIRRDLGSSLARS